MQVRISKLGVAHYLAPDGALTAENLPALQTRVEEARKAGASRVVLDLGRVAYFDSAGLEYLCDLAARLREEGGSLRLAGPNDLCRETLALTGIDARIPVHENLASAGRSFL